MTRRGNVMSVELEESNVFLSDKGFIFKNLISLFNSTSSVRLCHVSSSFI